MRYHSKHFEHLTKLLPSLEEPATYLTSDELTIIAGVPGESTAELEKVTIKGIEFAECSDHEASEVDSKENLYFALVQFCADLSVTAIASDAAEDVALAEWFGYTIEGNLSVKDILDKCVEVLVTFIYFGVVFYIRV